MRKFFVYFTFIVVCLAPFYLFLFGDLISKAINDVWISLAVSMLSVLPLVISSVFGMFALTMISLEEIKNGKSTKRS